MFVLSLGVRRQLIAAFVCSLAALIAGVVLGWPSPTIKKLREPGSYLHLTIYEESWVVNSLYYGTFLSPFPSGYIMNKLGRKNSLLLLCIFPTISWIFIYFSRSALIFMVARFFAGVWSGGVATVMPIYIAEISEPQVRGIFGTFLQLNCFLGTNFAFLIGPLISVQSMALLSTLLPIIFFALFYFCPESPYYDIMMGRHDRAAKSLSWLRGDAPTETEFEQIQTSIERETNQAGLLKKLKDLVMIKSNRKAFVVVEVMNLLQRLSGISCMMAYSSVVFPESGPISPDNSTVVMGVVWMLSCLCSAGLVEKTGRKPLMYISSIGICASMLWTGVWYYLRQETDIDVENLSWLPLAGFLVYGFAFSIGLGPLSTTYQGEMFPSNLKGQASAITVMITALSSAVSTFLFAVLTKNIGVYVNFFIYSLVGLATLFYTYFILIETKGKSLQMIQMELLGVKDDVDKKRQEVQA